MSQVYVEQNYAQKLNVCKNTTLNSQVSVTAVKKVDDKEQNGLLKTLDTWAQRSRQRKQLAQLDKYLLEDVGLTDEMVRKEIAKPFWR